MTSLGLGALIAAWSSSAISAEVKPSPDVASSGKLSVANTLDYAPFEYLDAEGKQTGIIVELAGEVAKLVKAELDIQRTPFPSMIPGLAAGRFKIAWETFSANPDRLKQVDFVMFIKAGIAASTSPEKKDSFAGDQPLCGKRIGVSAGSASDFLVDTLSKDCTDKGQKAIEKSVFNSSTDIVQAVLSDRVDARMDDATASSYFEVTSKGQLVVLPTLYDVAPLGLAIAKDDPATSDMMVAALAELFKNGKYQEILNKYGMGAYAIKEPYFVNSMDSLRAD
jgi:polar amino acid transport system substrate-binding protein